MATKAVEIDFSQLSSFFDQLEAAGNGALKQEIIKFIEGIGDEFLRIVSEEIIRREVVDTRLLLNSFQKGSSDGMWSIKDGGLTLEVGTNVEYASYVNDGHWTNPKGVERRFIPGDVVLDGDGKIIEFTYNPSAKTGMMLHQKWVEGRHFWEAAIRIMERMLPGLLDAKISEWLHDYLGI